MVKRFAVALVGVVVCSVAGYTQSVPNFSGTWKLDLTKSDYGDLPGPNSRIDVIEEHGDAIHETVVAEQRHKTQHYTLNFTTDGKTFTFAPGTAIHTWPVIIQSISATWHDSNLLVMEGLRFQGSDLIARNVYTLSPDRRTLTMTLSLNGKDTAATFVFDKICGKLHTAGSGATIGSADCSLGGVGH